MTAKEYLNEGEILVKDFHPNEPIEIRVEKLMVAFAEDYAKHYAADTLAELKFHKSLNDRLKESCDSAFDALLESEKELERLKESQNYLLGENNDLKDLLTQAEKELSELKKGQSEQLKALEKLKDFAYEVCPLHREDDLEEIVGSL